MITSFTMTKASLSSLLQTPTYLFMPPKSNKRPRPQNGQYLRELRESRRMRQTEFTEAFNNYLKQAIPDLNTSDLLTQSMLSDLELDKAELSITHWLALSQFFSAPSAELLSKRLQHIYYQEVYTETSAKHTHLATTFNDQPSTFFKVCNWFPTRHFTCSECFANLLKAKPSSQEHIEFYPLSSFIEFLFSPVGTYSKADKITILQRMLHYFSINIYQRLYFIPNTQQRLRDASIRIDAYQGKVSFLLPVDQQDLRYIHINNRGLAQSLHSYYQSIDRINDTLHILETAQRILAEDTPLQITAIRKFYQECSTTPHHKQWIRECFTPEIQQLLEEID